MHLRATQSAMDDGSVAIVIRGGLWLAIFVSLDVAFPSRARAREASLGAIC